MLQVVWFKRDLRSSDHAPLQVAAKHGPVLCLYVIERDYWQLPHTSDRQWQFVRESLQDLHQQLQARGAALQVVEGDLITTLDAIRAQHGPLALHSHEETGNLWSFARDTTVARWCRQQQVVWRQYKQFGVQRGSERNRDQWSQWRQQWLEQQPAPCPPITQSLAAAAAPAPAQWPRSVKTDPLPCPGRQPGGRTAGLALLQSFTQQRGEQYRGSLSRTDSAARHGSRLSAHLAYGTLSLREVCAATQRAHADATGRWRQSLAAFASRLWWHCHFIQKLESQPTIETTPQITVLQQLPSCSDRERLQRWQFGTTGWPLVDAAMRYLHHHGWVNFRMRAMLVSVATHTLQLPWQWVAEWLAGQFVDYEPGIHYPQVQMQSCLSWNPVLRIYNPTTQAQQLDPDGRFIRRWVPELANTPDAWLQQPWQLPTTLRQRFAGAADYPPPMVDHQLANRQRKAAIAAIEQREGIVRPSQRPAGSASRRQRGSKTPARAANKQQLSLF